MQTQLETPPRTAPVFARALVGIDASPESLEAARQAARIAGSVTLLSAYDLSAGLVAGVGPAVPAYLDEAPLRTAAEEAVESAREQIPESSPETLVATGRPWDLLLGELERGEYPLVVVGSHGTGRPLGILIGSTATELIHKAPCSVLVARKPLGEFAKRIVVGVDGSDESVAAYEVAEALAERFGATLEVLAADVDEDLDIDGIHRSVPHRVHHVPDLPVEALVTASGDADLVVVGSRGLTGLKALGSVSERVAHLAPASVLIVRRRP